VDQLNNFTEAKYMGANLREKCFNIFKLKPFSAVLFPCLVSCIAMWKMLDQTLLHISEPN